MSARNPKTTTGLGKTLEDRVAKDYRGERSRSSGAAAGRKGDVRFTLVLDRFDVIQDCGWEDNFEFLAECKVTEKKSFSLKKETWNKVTQEAREANRRPCMFVRFFDTDKGKHVDLVIRNVEDDLEMIR